MASPIRPDDLPESTTVNPNSAIVVDDGVTVRKATPIKVVDAAIPLASQLDAEAGLDNEKRMSSLRVKQAIDAQAATIEAVNERVPYTELASTAPGEGAALVAFEGGNTVQDLSVPGASTGGALVSFLPPSVTKSLRSIQDKLQEVLTLPDYGGIGDGSAHTVQEWIIPGSHGRYADLTALQVDYPHVTATTNCANWAALLKAVKVAQDNSLGYVKLGAGVFVFTQQVNLTGAGITIIGVESPNLQTGSIRTASTARWEGGAEAMWTTNSSSWVFHGFGIENGTVATDWLGMLSGSQRNTFSMLFGTAPNGTTRLGFSRSLVYSDGNRLGYGGMQHCIFNSIAPVLFDVQNAGTGNVITTFYIHHNVFAATTQNMAVFVPTGETIEILDIRNNTTIMDGFECTLLDTTSSPATHPVYSLNVENNEFDIDSGIGAVATWRFLKLENIANANISNNQWYGGAGVLTALVTLINSNVTSQSGNYFYSLNGYLYDPDATSTIAPGHNVRNTSNTNGDYPKDWLGNIGQPAFGAAMVCNPSAVPGENKIFHCNITGSGSFEIRCPTAKPYWNGAGQVITIAVRNVSGGVISATNFRSDTFSMVGGSTGITSPANGFQRIYTFYFDGTRFIEISRSSGDIAIV